MQHNLMKFRMKYAWTLALLAILSLTACQPIRPVSDAGNAPPLAPSDVTITIDETGIQGPREVASGLVKMTLKNSGQAFRTLFVSRLAADTTLQEAIALPPGFDASTNTFIGGGFFQAGASYEVLLDLAPGGYYIVDFIGETPVAHEFVVSETAIATTTAPTTVVTVTEEEFAFVMPDEVTAGAHWWQIENTGELPHDFSLYKLEDGQTLEALLATVQAEEAQPPATRTLLPMQQWGTGVGQTNWLHLDLAAGEYAVLSLTPDFSTMPPGEANYLKGMVRTFTVVE